MTDDIFDPIFPGDEPEEKPITQSILLTIKKMLGIAEEYHAFDLDIITVINGIFLTLNQLGVGPKLPYAITGTTETWANFLGDQQPYLAGVRTYVYMRTRLAFDPPTNSFLVASFQDQCKEFEWRFMVQPKTEEDVSAVESWKDTLPTNPNYAPREETPPEEPPAEEKPQAMKATRTKARKVNLLDKFS